MTDYNPKIIAEKEAEKIMTKLGSEKAGVIIMLPKTKYRLVKLEKVRNSLASILKQEMLSAGGDAAVHKKTTRCQVKTTDVLLMGTLKHYQLVIRKMMAQPHESKNIAEALAQILFDKTPQEVIKKIIY